MARCLVTGGLGFVGSHVVDALIDEGHQVTIIDNLSTGKITNKNPKAKLYRRDVREAFTPLPPYDYVFHLAALARIQPSIENPLESHDVNLTGTLNVLEYCRRTRAKLIFSSSSSIYDGIDLPSKESFLRVYPNPYSLQKLASEFYIELYNYYHGVEYCTLRYFNVFGERQILDGAYAAIVGIFLDQKSKDKPMTITNNGEQRRDFTYVKDVAKANVLAMGWEGVYNIGSGRNYSINELAARIGGDKKYIGERKGEAQETLADISKAKAKGWQPTVDIMEWVDGQIKA